MPTYISPDGFQKMKEELTHRKTALRREIAEKIAAAKELGDLSENFEYHDAKDQQGHNEVRIAQLGHMIQDAVIVDEKKGGEIISIGTTFDVEQDGTQYTYSMCGSQEANPLKGKISNESPIGLAYLGKKRGEEVHITLPNGHIVHAKILTVY